mmetsp:Transcript_36980/g.82204  ORF Transcript_36980/g.82204 Transcript_36980/m.82204 type:complete len:137 (+) Transcript_36980:252-662(+)|eukprot:CAMPEP_0202893034 /NCGR_PEP_ID=MMETSP1392-20130828/2686_1 /ASSEMBLY_ACC=CAM_ASM_000868 /TAXON_ID=225041 /ORGANISM="Chlamydomonas chlamydogama, Strain SAG 11-48b" /LENGTH=136 /DNA_ID=CAMNT_0049577215 /DNA_START=248 /DNA_END=658 /DNA_ORIENTATION=-
MAEREIVNEFQAKRQRLSETWNKITEFSAEVAEHDMVLKALEPMEGTRRCFRLVGEVLVERTVSEVMPAVAKNKENLESVIQSLQENAKKQEKELSDFQAKYKIRIVRNNGDEEEEEAQAAASSSQGSQGVLVSDK